MTGFFKRYRLDPWAFAFTVLALFVSTVVYFSLDTLQTHLRDIEREHLEAVNASCSQAVETWAAEMKAHASYLARDEKIVTLSREMLIEDGDSAAKAIELPRVEFLLTDLVDLAIVDRNGRILTFLCASHCNEKEAESRSSAEASLDALREQLQRRNRVVWDQNVLFSVFHQSKTIVSSTTMLPAESGEELPNLIYAVAPISIEEQGDVATALVLMLDPNHRFYRYFEAAYIGETGETFAVDLQKRLITPRRFPARVAGENAPHVPEIAGTNVNGYEDYRGATVLGAWRWLPEEGIAIVTEIDAQEAYHSLLAYRRWLQTGMYLSLVTLFGSLCLVYVRYRKLKRQPKFEASTRLGQYDLSKVIGRGGMGTVYLAYHEFLRRRTAVKLIRGRDLDKASIARFEREVRLASKLRHPNTVSIYDYGHPEDDVFFYAMEFVEGITLQQLIEQYGPISEGRVILILKQICNALHEAHSIGLIHRDVKPSNVMLTQGSGMSDFVKLLDFGLVKSPTQDDLHLTRDNVIAGTPEYVSPEAIENPSNIDSRCDIYSVGAVGYYLLTGQPIFTGSSAIDICMKRLVEDPKRPSVVLKRAIDPRLERVLMECLSRDPRWRPQSARDLKSRLEQCTTARDWSFEAAEVWWTRHHESTAELEKADAQAQADTEDFGATKLVPQDEQADVVA